MYQSQQSEGIKNAFCGMYSVNNALQHPDFLTRESMIPHLEALGAEHGDVRFGAYSIKCLQRALQQWGYKLLYLNNMSTYKNVSKRHWYQQISDSKWLSMLIIGVPSGQKGQVPHCIARTKAWYEDDTLEERDARPFNLICPDEGVVKRCTPEQIFDWVGELLWIYAIVPIEVNK